MTYKDPQNHNLKEEVSQWNFIYVFLITAVVFTALFLSVMHLQMVDGNELSVRADENEVELSYDYPLRGVIFDRDGEPLAENVAATNLVLVVNKLYSEDQFDNTKLDQLLTQLDVTLGDGWFEPQVIADTQYDDPREYILSRLSHLEEKEGTYARYSEIVLANDLDNDMTISLKADRDKLDQVRIEEGYRRKYLGGVSFSHLLGYTSPITAEDLEYVDYLGYDELVALNGFRDVLGRLGVESVYDQDLIGVKGVQAVETDALGNVVSEISRTIQPVENGKNLHISISSKAQVKMYETLTAAIKKYGATGASGVVQDVETGELIVMVTAPSFDNNDFIGGISQKKYSELLNNKQIPLLNRSISAQLPPGSTFKTLTALGALESGSVDENTIYVSRSDYTFSDGAPFQEYHGNSYGRLDIIDALTVSSNIFFCESIRNSDIEKFVPTYKKFGIGSLTGIDIEGETPGRLPSPENKIELANTPGITWLDPVWYPEGDSCNTAIGQGITLVTPLQMSNWIAAIANGGTLNTPHIAKYFTGEDDEKENIDFEVHGEEIVNKKNLEIVRTGMRNAVAGERRSISALTAAKFPVAAKTGTAEFGALNSKGEYEHTHAWVTGFFPYEDPKYSFVLLLEDGGESYFSAEVMKTYLDWWYDNMPQE